MTSIPVSQVLWTHRSISGISLFPSMDEAIENIDIGGPSMLRSAAKNYKDVTVVCDPADYDTILAEIRDSGAVRYLRRSAPAVAV